MPSKTRLDKPEPYIELPARSTLSSNRPPPPSTSAAKSKSLRGAAASATTAKSKPSLKRPSAPVENAGDAAASKQRRLDPTLDRTASGVQRAPTGSPRKTANKDAAEPAADGEQLRNEEDAALHRSTRAKRTYGGKGKQKGKGRGKGKGKAVEPEPEPEVEAEEEEADLDEEEVDELADAPAERKSPAKRMATRQRTSPPKKQKRGAAPKRAQPNTSDEEATPPAEEDTDGEGSASSDDGTIDEERPPKMFMHYADGGWHADQMWLHNRWVKPGKRAQVVKYIKHNGGKVMKSMVHAEIVILPDWTDSEYTKLYGDAIELGATSVGYGWLQDAARQTARSGAPFRPLLSDYFAPAPKRSDYVLTDRRNKRYNRLTEPELEAFAEWYNKWKDGVVGKEEMFERMQGEFYDVRQSHRTTTSAFRAAFDTHKHEIKTLARRLREDRPARSASHSPAPDPPRRKRRASPSPSLSASLSLAFAPPPVTKYKRQHRGASQPAPDSFSTALSILAASYRVPLAFSRTLCLACTLDVARTERVLRRLREWEAAADTGTAAEEQRWEAATREVWGAEEDAVLRDAEAERAGEQVSDAGLVEKLGGRWSVEEVKERRELLRALGDQAVGWTLTRAELRRIREGSDGADRLGVGDEDDDDPEEDASGEEGEVIAG